MKEDQEWKRVTVMSVSDDIEVLFVEIKLLELEIKRKRNRIETLRKQEKENK